LLRNTIDSQAMRSTQIALQLYTLREFTATPADFLATLRRVREIGFTAVELAGTAGLPPDEAAKMVRDSGMEICSSHESPKLLLESPQAVVDRLGDLGVSHAVYPWPDGMDFSNSSGVDTLITALESAGSLLQRSGMTLCYHNHAHEFYRNESGPVLEQIFSRTSPNHVQAELDIHCGNWGVRVEWR